MKKPSPISVNVASTQAITPNMHRISLQSDALKAFPSQCEGGYIKLMFTPSGDTDLSSLTPDQKPVMRTYTIRSYDQQKGTIAVDFVKHVTEDLQCGFAARWAMGTKVGSSITIGGPGIIQEMNTDADWFFTVADMTALPALSAKIKQLPQHARGYAVVKLLTSQDAQPIESPENIEVLWIDDNDDLAETLCSLPWLEGNPSVWCACEFDDMKKLRQYFRNEKAVDRQNIYISSYWKRGVVEDGHKVIKRQDAEAQPD